MRRLKTVRRPPIYPKTPGHLPCSSLTHPLPLSSHRPSVSFGGFGLRKIQTFGERLRAQVGGDLRDEGIDYLGRMQNASERMGRLIDDLLTLSRVATRGQPFVPVDLSEVAQDVVSDLAVVLEESGGTVELGDLPLIQADRVQLHQLLQNLISNALKFRRAGEAPIVKVNGGLVNGDVKGLPVAAHSDELCQITVEDNGIGFDEKYVDRIFTVFQRLHGRGEYEGTGIGLSLCRNIAERHGGTITAKSRPGQGTTFTVILAAHRAAEEGLR